MNPPTALASNRVIAASWWCLGLLIIWAVVPLTAQEASPVTTLALDESEANDGVQNARSVVFSGQPHRFEWGFRSEAIQNGKPRLSLYRILSSTVVPIEEEVILAPELHLQPGEISVVGYLFNVPDTSSEARYLAKLWFDIKGNATLVGTMTILAVPKDLLSKHHGVNLLLCGFGGEEEKFRKFFESFSWVVTTAELLPETITADIIATAPETKPFPTVFGPTFVYRDLTLLGAASPPSVSLIRNHEGGKVTRYELSVNRWTSVPVSAAAQYQLSSILSELLKTP